MHFKQWILQYSISRFLGKKVIIIDADILL